MCDCDVVQPNFFRELLLRSLGAGERCCECSLPITKGEHYWFSYGYWEDRFDRYKTCLNCRRLWQELEVRDIACQCFGGLWEAIWDSDLWYRRGDPGDDPDCYWDDPECPIILEVSWLRRREDGWFEVVEVQQPDPLKREFEEALTSSHHEQ